MPIASAASSENMNGTRINGSGDGQHHEEETEDTNGTRINSTCGVYNINTVAIRARQMVLIHPPHITFSVYTPLCYLLLHKRYISLSLSFYMYRYYMLFHCLSMFASLFIHCVDNKTTKQLENNTAENVRRCRKVSGMLPKERFPCGGILTKYRSPCRVLFLFLDSHKSSNLNYQFVLNRHRQITQSPICFTQDYKYTRCTKY